jgi:acetyl esterase/lipase
MRQMKLCFTVVTLLSLIGSAFPQEKQPTRPDVKYGPHARNVLDFWPAESKQPTPLRVSIHGGGFRGGNKSVSPALLKECLDSGISVAASTYRLSDQAIAPAQFHDCARALQFLRHKAHRGGGGPSRGPAAERGR